MDTHHSTQHSASKQSPHVNQSDPQKEYITGYDEQVNEEKLSKKLDIIENIREEAEMKETAYKRRIKRIFNKRLGNVKLTTGDLILRNAHLTMTEQNKGKLSQNWEGPYIIKEEWKTGTRSSQSKKMEQQFQELGMQVISRGTMISDQKKPQHCVNNVEICIQYRKE